MNIFVKPMEGRRCKDPNTFELLSERGKRVPKNSYWIRRIKEGDCVEVESVVKSKQEIIKPKSKKKCSKRQDKISVEDKD